MAGMDNFLIVNCGNFSSLDNFYQSVGKSLHTITSKKAIEQITLDCSLISRNKNIRISVLTTLLAFCSQIRNQNLVTPKILLGDDMSVLQFLKDCNFYLISKTDNLIDWGNYEHGGEMLIQFRNIGCKIISFSKTYEKYGNRAYSLLEITTVKNILQSDVPRIILPEFASILAKTERHDKRFLLDILSKIISEYVINALLHGKAVAYLAVQVSKWGISVCIADSGLGILKSMQSNYNSNWATRVKLDSDVDAILNASLKQNISIGLRDSIQSVIDNGGYTIVSTGNSEIIWDEETWRIALNNFDHGEYQNVLQSHDRILSQTKKLSNYNYYENTTGGYHKFSQSLPGTRIFFEMPIIYI